MCQSHSALMAETELCSEFRGKAFLEAFIPEADPILAMTKGDSYGLWL